MDEDLLKSKEFEPLLQSSDGVSPPKNGNAGDMSPEMVELKEVLSHSRSDSGGKSLKNADQPQVKNTYSHVWPYLRLVFA